MLHISENVSNFYLDLLGTSYLRSEFKRSFFEEGMSERMKEIFLLLIWAWKDVTIFFIVRNTFKISFHNVYNSMCSVIFYMNNAQRYPSIPLYVIYLCVTHNMEISTSEACTYTYIFRYVIFTKSSYSDISFNDTLRLTFIVTSVSVFIQHLSYL